MKQYRRSYGVVLLIALAQLLAAKLSFGATPTYVRISRAFFEKPLQAQVKLSSQSDSKIYSSPVSWVQYPPTAPAPQQNDPQLGQVLADFRDFVACAEMSALGQSRLCFKVMADVSNLGLNDNEMTLRGIETISANSSAQAAGQCSEPASSASGKTAADGGAPSRYTVQKATVTANSLELEFKYTGGCGPNVQLTLTQVP